MDLSKEAFQKQKLVRHENLMWLIVAQGVVILPLLIKLPIWLALFWFVALLWRLRIHAGKLAFPSGIVKFILSFVAIAGLIGSYLGAYGVESMVGFLVLTFILKLLELRTRKDGLLLLFIGFIAVAAQFLFTQSIWTAVYAFISCLVLIAAWQTIYLTRYFNVKIKLQMGGVLLLHALPLMVVMFLIMPRLGPLWRTPLLNAQSHTGFSDSVSPGDFSQIVRDKGTAFRVNFNSSNIPKVSEMYWRGLVLDQFDGRTWTRANDVKGRKTQVAYGNESAQYLVDYDIIIEPHQYKWLFSLAKPVKVTTQNTTAAITQVGLISSRDPIMSRLHYRVMSLPSKYHPIATLTKLQRGKYLSLPDGFNPKSIALGEQWQSEESSVLAIINKASNWYRSSFNYTLQPPLLNQDSVDDFLFNTQSGFCEHFASSFTVLMRAAGIPTRLVVGYQGGTYNDLQDYWQISQADAHAWSEVWIEGQGWVQIDPTSWVAESRIDEGINNALTESDRQLVAGGQFVAPQWLNNLRHRLDAANYMWSRWVLSYNPDKQNQLLKQLFGGAQPWRIGVAFIVLISVLIGGYTLVVIRPKWRTKTPLQRALQKFDKTCSKWGCHRRGDESIAKFAQRLSQAQPQLKDSCSQLGQISQRALYAEDNYYQVLLITSLQQFPKIMKL